MIIHDITRLIVLLIVFNKYLIYRDLQQIIPIYTDVGINSGNQLKISQNYDRISKNNRLIYGGNYLDGTV